MNITDLGEIASKAKQPLTQYRVPSPIPHSIFNSSDYWWLNRLRTLWRLLFRIGRSNPAMSFLLARAPIARERIARWHNGYRFPRRKSSQKSLYRRQFLVSTHLTTDNKRAATQRLPDVTNG
jgi:hypothetical protein